MHKPPAKMTQGECSPISALIHRSTGKRERTSITRLWFDGCEMDSAEPFEPGEPVEIEFGMMGKIRARVVSSAGSVLSVRFDEECPV